MEAATPEDSFKRLLADFPAVVNASKTLPRRPSGDVEHHIVTAAAAVMPFSPPGWRETGSGEGRIPSYGEGGHHQEVQQSMVLHSPYGAGAGRVLATMRRLSAAEFGNGTRFISSSQHVRLLGEDSRLHHLQQGGPSQGISQILMHPGDIPKTAIATPFGLFKFLRMTFGLRNAGNTFQRLMDRILAGLDFVFVYLDNVIIGSRSMSEHLQHVRTLFWRLQAGHQPPEMRVWSA
jgi:hypothetical protein